MNRIYAAACSLDNEVIRLVYVAEDQPDWARKERQELEREFRRNPPVLWRWVQPIAATHSANISAGV